ncbi:hypothetical protein [Nannocystis punicea]|uniref:Uncharacterized protein n=1 Tax=Nannocystis punicea TaxID=2995304 RepID=A0ABY7GUG0_9BACT|nr:hypothetical protein [Nannocystis poenicansa]WAS90588.1 hypothetical protein O0S08_30745 [Nannocystis poenicansa]
MRPSIKVLVALNFSLAAASAGCDELAADDLAGQPDEPVSLRCEDPPNCWGTNSPYVGNYQFSNVRTREGVEAPTPSVNSDDDAKWETGKLQLADSSWVSFDFLAPTAEGQLIAHIPSTNTYEPLDQALQAFFVLRIHRPAASPPTQLVPIWLRHHDVSPSPATPTFRVWTYTIAAMATPPSGSYPSEGVPPSLPPGTPFGPNPWDGTYYSICPASLHETGKALALQHVALNFDGQAAWLEGARQGGSYDLKQPSTSVLACQGHAFAKPQEFLAISPNSYHNANDPGERSYGISGYNAAANAYRAYFDGAPRTVLGTPINFKDLAHNPPWFDQTTPAFLPTPPIIGDWEFVLESVYKDVDANGDVLGANCYYTESRFLAGVHRLFSPPGTSLPGWSNMASCGATQSSWSTYGPIGAFVMEFIDPLGGGAS